MADSKVTSSIKKLRIRDFSAEDDIRVFLRDSFTGIYERRRQYMADVEQPWPSEDIMDTIVIKTSGLFIFASTVINFINSKHGHPDRQLERVLGVDGQADMTPYAGLDRLYAEVLASIGDNPEGELVARIIVLLFNPLRLRDLAKLLFKTPGEIQFDLQDLQSVIMMPDNEEDPVRIYHTSFRDFLVDPRRSSLHAVNQPLSHRSIAQFCLDLMTKELSRDACRIRDPSKLNSEVPDLKLRCSTNFSGAAQYACRYWATHVSKSDEDTILIEHLRKFLFKSLLHWLEALSLLERFEDSAISSIATASEWVKKLAKPPSDIVELLYDAMRMVKEFFDPISVSALHVYHSALPLLPSSTLIRRTYAHEIIGVVSVLRGLPEKWGGCLRVMSTSGPVLSVAFSPDDAYVASATKEDGIQLWRTSTGVNFATLGAEGNISCPLRFAPVGGRLAVGGQDGTTYCWDVETGLSIMNSKEHERPVACVLFAPDGLQLASASGNQIRIWDSRTGNPLRLLSGHADIITSLSFSPISMCLISASKDTTLCQWQPNSPTPLSLKGHKGSILSVSFSPDGTKFASGSEDKTVRIWDAYSGVCLATNKAHHDRVIAVQFSSDSNSVISVSDDLSVKSFTTTNNKSTTIWSFSPFYRKAIMFAPMSWMLQKFAALTLERIGRSEITVETFAFSKDVPPLAFTMKNTAILVRDLEASEEPPFADLGSPSSALALGTYMAFGSSVKDISIYDPNIRDQTWEQFATKFQQTEIIAASSDGSRFLTTTFGDMQLFDAKGFLVAQLNPQGVFGVDRMATATRDFAIIAIPSRMTNAIHIFDGHSGAKLPDLKGSGWAAGIFDAENSSSAFSADGTLLALGNINGGVDIRSVNSGRSIARIKGTKEAIKCLAFSPDNKHAAFGDSEGAVLCWNITTDITKRSSLPHVTRVRSVVFSPDGRCIVSGATNGSLRCWYPHADHFTIWEGTSTATPPKSISFHSTARGLCFSCRSERGAVEVWTFEEASKDEAVVPKPLSRTSDRCILANQVVGSNVFLTGDGWLFDGSTRMCWIPKSIRPRDDEMYWRGSKLTYVAGRSFFIADMSTIRRD